MKGFFLILKAGTLMVCTVSAHAEENADKRLADLTAEVIKVATPGPGIGVDGQEVSKKLMGLDHEKVVEAMLPLLKHEKKGVPLLASYVIRDCSDGVKPEHFLKLKEGYGDDGGWLPGAIAAVGTDEAAEFLVNAFRADPEIHAQLDWAIVSMGERAVPFLLKQFDEADPERENGYFKGLRHLFKGDNIYEGMKEKAQTAIPHLMKIAENENADLLRRQEAVMTVGSVGKAAIPYFARLKEIARKAPDKFGDAVKQALIASETSSTAEVLADMVDAGGGQYTVRDIALLGDQAKDVGPRVLGWLDHPDWDIRVMAARILGAIGYKDAVKPLEGLLRSKIDWRLAYVATKSLADLKSVDSLPALEAASREHWFPIVREAAKNALGHLKDGDELKGYGATEAGDLVDFVFVDREQLSIQEEDLKGVKPRKPSAGRKSSFMAFKEREPESAKKFIAARHTSGEEMLEGLGSMIEIPFNDGRLLGASAGEWGGGLQYAPKEGGFRKLLEQNVTGIEKWKDRFHAVSGGYHMGMNEGIIHEVVVKDGEVSTVPWFVLPGMSTGMWVTEDGKLVVASVGGTLIFTDKDHFQYQPTD